MVNKPEMHFVLFPLHVRCILLTTSLAFNKCGIMRSFLSRKTSTDANYARFVYLTTVLQASMRV